MDDLITQRRALAARADLLARSTGRALTRDERRLLARYDTELPETRIALETRAKDQSAGLMTWCATRTDPTAPMTTEERSTFAVLAAEHRATRDRLANATSRTAAPAPMTSTTLRQRLAALSGI